MQRCLNVGDREVKDYCFDEKEVQRYQQFFNMPQTTTVPLFMTARVWPLFSLFQPFKETAIQLVATEMEAHHPLKVGVHYQVTMAVLKVQQIKAFQCYQMTLSFEQGDTCHCRIIQTFVSRRAA
ncbi:hypothetical protein [Staphylococcus intermedius]|uniref:Protein vraC n=1 Tax=Staphylococcus intermedius NCTC 11048 TaxID=1141106 RepID=A0A380G9B2_STAIN|nr:hypothetical protein [Staphylococcus intermedius]PCF65641.1 hypothetical protein B5C04_06195 [Staphylococcus intermedius]PCF81320.1 hypothetical protein B4W74_06545 [Staphylococcus intermedius]PCF82602.1 hypothetical protein B4W70_06185 [Staphylococcus intermedius]PCF87302.1 hypothetical protein B4W75_09460 [Staphylococcus intermedius]PNZ53980.1 hypothetical protein CD138_03560 [Staphylococcus intermedius NCTC 11048]